MTGFCSSPRLVEHDTGPHHPERPDRIRTVYRGLTSGGYLQSPDPFPEFQIDLGELPPAKDALVEITPQPVDEAMLRLVHTQGMIERVRNLAAEGGGLLDGGDTVVSPTSYDTALLGVGSAVSATAAVLEGKVHRAFAAPRPTGHHAEPDRSMGFCLFANVAIAARVAQQRFGVKHIAIIDIDVHHGNGTQAVFEDDPDVLFVSLHQHPRTCYPGTGFASETGLGHGEGATLNLPLPPGTGDEDYLGLIDETVAPRLYDFAPELLFISAGFDAHRDDPLADLHLTERGFYQITRRLTAMADMCCGGRVVSVMEGGYNLHALGRSVVHHVLALQS
jgi:acetoin utilization deacetylase AcuC-like enzyme